MLVLTATLFASLGIVVTLYLLYIRSVYDFFTKLNIPGPVPNFFFGNFLDIVQNKRLSLTINGWTKMYGHVFGYFQGHTPILVVSDPDILQDIFTTSFSNFHSRPFFPLIDPNSKLVHLFFAAGARWKRQRFVVNPIFSSGKLKQMIPLIQESVKMLMIKLSEECVKGEIFDIYPYFKRLTMQTIWSCGFGIDVDMQTDINNPYLVASQQLFSGNINYKFLALLAIFLVELNTLITKIYLFIGFFLCRIRRHFPLTQRFITDDPVIWITNEAYKMIDKYQKNNVSGRTDLLKSMLEVATNEEFIDDEKQRETCINENDCTVSQIRQLTKHEIAANIVLFIIAGSESTSTTLAFASYLMASNPDQQRKLQEHIDAHFNPETEDEMPSYEIVSQMDYLDMVIREVLRMYPVATGISRKSSEEYYIEGFGKIPPSTDVTLDVYKLHFDPDLWGPIDPNQFYPERFAIRRHPFAWVPFGGGPRQCIGMRFAFVQMKIALVRMLKSYNIVDCGNITRQPVEELQETLVIAPKSVKIRLERRNTLLK